MLHQHHKIPAGVWSDRLHFELARDSAQKGERWQEFYDYHQYAKVSSQYGKTTSVSGAEEAISPFLELKHPRILFLLMARDAADTLLSCLQSVENLVETHQGRYVLADTGSTDQTLSIMKAWQRRHSHTDILNVQWPEHFARARNVLLSHARSHAEHYHWCLTLDADERLMSDSEKALSVVLQKLPRREQVFAFTGYSDSFSDACSDSRGSTEGSAYLVERMFPLKHPLFIHHTVTENRVRYRHSELIYHGALHERLGYAQRIERVPVHALEDVGFMHSGYTAEAYTRHHKHARFELLARVAQRDGQHNPYLLFQYARALFLQKQDARWALEVLQESVALSQKYQGRPPCVGWFSVPVAAAEVLEKELRQALCQCE